MIRNLLNDEAGFLVSAELFLIFTLVFCAVAAPAETAATFHAVCSGSGFADEADDCDCKGIVLAAPTNVKADPSTLNRAEGT